MSDLISVIVPVYNVSRYLDGCVDSISKQSYSNLEIILVDDGSTDASGELCDRWAEKDARIQVIHQQNGGLSDARNAGIAHAHGAYLMFVDSDDTIAPDAIRTMDAALHRYGCEIAVCNMVRVYDDGGQEPFYAPVQEETLLTGLDRFQTLQQPSACNKLFQASLFDGIHFPKGKFYEDTFVYHNLAMKASAIVLTGEDGYFYLSRRGSILGTPRYTDRYFDFVEAVYTRATDLTAQKIPDYSREACLSLYAAVADGERYLKKTPENRGKIRQMRMQYRFAWTQLMHSPDVGAKQKLRLILLRFCPSLHSRIYR